MVGYGEEDGGKEEGMAGTQEESGESKGRVAERENSGKKGSGKVDSLLNIHTHGCKAPSPSTQIGINQ